MIGSEGRRALISFDGYAHGLGVGLAETCISMMVHRDGQV